MLNNHPLPLVLRCVNAGKSDLVPRSCATGPLFRLKPIPTVKLVAQARRQELTDLVTKAFHVRLWPNLPVVDLSSKFGILHVILKVLGTRGSKTQANQLLIRATSIHNGLSHRLLARPDGRGHETAKYICSLYLFSLRA